MQRDKHSTPPGFFFVCGVFFFFWGGGVTKGWSHFMSKKSSWIIPTRYSKHLRWPQRSSTNPEEIGLTHPKSWPWTLVFPPDPLPPNQEPHEPHVLVMCMKRVHRHIWMVGSNGHHQGKWLAAFFVINTFEKKVALVMNPSAQTLWCHPPIDKRNWRRVRILNKLTTKTHYTVDQNETNKPHTRIRNHHLLHHSMCLHWTKQMWNTDFTIFGLREWSWRKL